MEIYTERQRHSLESGVATWGVGLACRDHAQLAGEVVIVDGFGWRQDGIERGIEPQLLEFSGEPF